MSGTFRTWLKFNAVGLAGIGVQLLALGLFKSVLKMNYLPATGLAVEAAVLHNFVWHERWTWAARTREAPEGLWGRLARFHMTNGLISIAGNLALMWLFVSRLHLHYFVANLMSIAACSIVNFFASHHLVFSPAWGRRSGEKRPN